MEGKSIRTGSERHGGIHHIHGTQAADPAQKRLVLLRIANEEMREGNQDLICWQHVEQAVDI